MPNALTKSLHLCFSKPKRPTKTPPPQPTGKPPHRLKPTATTTVFFKNFNSVYDFTSSDDSETLLDSTTSKSVSLSSDLSSSESDADHPPPPDFAAVFASQRFFFSSPGRSNSIVESPECLTPSTEVVGGGVAIPTYSPDPYMDFRRSMQEMVEARDLNVRVDWAYLHELLRCYLTLNRKHTHKFIVGAFADLLVTLMAPDGQRSEFPY